MDRVLVTGANGFIGRTLVPRLQAAGYKVRVLLRHAKDAARFENAEVVIGDITDPHSLQNCCDDVTTIYHLAGLAHDNKTHANDHMKVNFYGTSHLIKAGVDAGVKHFIYFSSVKAADNNSPYGVSKRKAEEFLLHQAESYQFHATVLRPALVYGPGCKGNLASMLRAIDKGFFIPIPETNNYRSMISLNDVCKAAMLAVDPRASGKSYFLTDGKDYSSRYLYESFNEALAKKIPNWHVPLTVFKVLAGIGDKVKKFPFNSQTLEKLFGSAQYDGRLIMNELNFQASDDLKSMLPEMVRAYKGVPA